MILKPVQKSCLRHSQTFSKFFYAMAILGGEEYPVRVLLQRYSEKDDRVQVQPTTCNTGRSVWIAADFLLEEMTNHPHVT